MTPPVAATLATRAHMTLRRSVPRALVPLIIETRTQMHRRNALIRAEAARQMRFLTGAQNGEVDALVDRYLAMAARRAEYRWHPDFITRQPVENIGLLAGRRNGIVLSFLHHGHYDGCFASLNAAGSPVTVLFHAGHEAPGAAAWRKQLMKVLGEGGDLLSAKAGSDAIRERLNRSEVVAIASDMIGQTPVQFLGKDLIGSFGAARLALETSSQVVVVTAHPQADGEPRLILSGPLNPSDFGDAHDLLREILRIHEPAVLAWPEAYDRPLARWGRLDGASPRDVSGAS